MESDLHLAMKGAVVRYLVDGERYWTESRVWYSGLRVDVSYMRKRRHFLVECETRPGVKRLVEKGRRRNTVPYRNVYILVVTAEWFRRLELRRLKGYFDRVLVYDDDCDRFTDSRDLRRLGWLRDSALDILVPIYYSKRFQNMLRTITMCKGRFKLWVRMSLQCPMCRLGIPTPWWRFCLRDKCPEDRSLKEIVESGVRWLESWLR